METQGKSRFDFIFKIVLVGDSTTGKTSLISRYVDDTFSTSTLTTIGIDFKLKTVEVEGYRVKLQLWDTAGQERYAPMGEMYYRGSHACLVVYDITRKSTFNNMPRWLNKISELKSDDKSLIVLVGCKADLSDIREVSSDTGQKLAIEEGARWVEVSSKNGEGVEQLFSDIARHLVLKKTDYLHQSSDMSREPVSSFDVVPRLPSVTLIAVDQ